MADGVVAQPPPFTAMQLKLHASLSEIDPQQWQQLCGDANLFVSYPFLLALEQSNCLQPFGWTPRYVTLSDDNGELIAATPAYLKTNSYGEFVFDWAWADFYQRHGVDYYPKLVVGVPYTPVSGQRLLCRDPSRRADLLGHFNQALIGYCQREKLSGLHWLFCTEPEMQSLESQGLFSRLGCQYHWRNHDYQNFEHYLTHFASRKRKNVRKERQKVRDQQIQFVLKDGHQMSNQDWQLTEQFYRSTFDDKWGTATLNLGFFQQVGRTMPDNVLVIFAELEGRKVAAAICFKDQTTLYGRYWGCLEQFDSLHFETCYYQGIDYCIEHGLQRFEPGAQGTHKISRGFLPTRTFSAHWLADPRFEEPIRRHCRQEWSAMQEECVELMQHSPFRHHDD